MNPNEGQGVLPFALDAHPRMLAPWLLRDDGDNLLLYKCTSAELKYRVLSPAQAMILPFFSGERSYERDSGNLAPPRETRR